MEPLGHTLHALRRQVEDLQRDLARACERRADAEQRAARAEKSCREAWDFAKWLRHGLRPPRRDEA